MSRLLLRTAIVLLSNGESTRCSKLTGELFLGIRLELEMYNGDDVVGVVDWITLPKPSGGTEHFGEFETGETGELVKWDNDVDLGSVVGKALLFFLGKIGGVLLVLLTFKPSDNSEATNISSSVIKGGLDVVEEETASAVFFGFLVFLARL
jgi:hypothetical protein